MANLSTAELDRIKAFLEERIEARPNDAQAYIRSEDLYHTYKDWAEGRNEQPLSRSDLPAYLHSLGCQLKDNEISELINGLTVQRKHPCWMGLRYKLGWSKRA
jgi:hypothetical protein